MKFKTAVSSALTASLLCSTVLPFSVSAQSDATVSFYNEWKDKYVVKNPYSSESQYYVCYSEEKFSDTNTETAVTVSEAHGYGMLITASMAEYDNSAKDIFDGMYRFYSEHTSETGKHLMAWQQSDNGKAIIDTNGKDSASDGDIDIAYSLLIADEIWGSNGDIDYKQSAINIINDIMEYEVNKTDWLIQLGDWVYNDKDSDYYSATRSSDFIMQYFPVFAEYTDDDRWLNVYNNTYSIISQFNDTYGNGLLPDFIIKDNDGKFIPAPANFLESENDGNYYYNSCRCPWRIGMDYLINKNPVAKEYAENISSFLYESTKNNPWEIIAGYTPDGKAVEDYNDLCFVAPVLISSACTDNQEWHGNIRETVIDYGDDIYFGDTIKMLCLIIDDGNWIVPENSYLAGDINSDGVCNIADAVLLQKWILDDSDINLPDWKAGDLCKDGQLNIFDLCVLKQKLSD